MEVQIRKRTNAAGVTRYQAVIQPWHEGKRKTISCGTFATEREAIAAGAKEASKYETDGQKAAALRGKTTLSAWAEEWLKSRVGKVKESTHSHYTWRLNNWVLPHLGQIRLADLSDYHIRRWLDSLELSNHAKKLALDVLKTCLSGAVADRALTTNPAAGLKVDVSRALQKAEKQAKPIKAWSHEDASLLLKASNGQRVEPLVVMGLLCGLRPGETQGLLWSDFDWINSEVTIRRSRTGTPNGVITTTSPKSGLSRTIKMPFEAVRRMMAIQERQEQGRFTAGSNEVFSVDPSKARRMLLKLCKELGVQELPPHSLRHTYASLALSGGAKIAAVSATLGHANSAITLGVYTHALPKDVEEVGGLVERLLVEPEIEAAHNHTQDAVDIRVSNPSDQ